MVGDIFTQTPLSPHSHPTSHIIEKLVLNKNCLLFLRKFILRIIVLLSKSRHRFFYKCALALLIIIDFT